MWNEVSLAATDEQGKKSLEILQRKKIKLVPEVLAIDRDVKAKKKIQMQALKNRLPVYNPSLIPVICDIIIAYTSYLALPPLK